MHEAKVVALLGWVGTVEASIRSGVRDVNIGDVVWAGQLAEVACLLIALASAVEERAKTSELDEQASQRQC